MQIQAAVLRATNTPLAIETLELAEPRSGEVLVEMKASGVCHSDWHVVTGDSAVDLPVVLGHEGSGVVAALGPDVEDLTVGDHVALSWIPYCGACRVCDDGHTHLCATFQPTLWAGTMLDGTRRLTDADGEPVFHLSAISTWSTHSVVPAVSCVKMPDVPFEISALIGCGVTTGVGAALNKAKITSGTTVAVAGAGGVGLSVVMGAALAGAERIVVLDREAAKRDLALELGATEFVSVADATEIPSAVRAATSGRGVDVIIDAVGLASIESVLLDALAPHGTAVLVGIPGPGAEFTVDPIEFIRQEKILTGSIFGSARTDRDFVAYAEWYLDGRLPLDRLITKRYPLDEINEACADMLTGTAGRGVLVF